MAQQGHLIPKYFSLLTTIRFFASGFFLATTIRLGHLASDLATTNAHKTLLHEGFALEDIRLLRAGLAIESVVGIGATLWALCNILGEATDQLRRSAIIGCVRADLIVIVFSALSIVLQKDGTAGTRCHGTGVQVKTIKSMDDTARYLANWCSRFELAFRFTVVMVVFASIGLFFEIRWMVHKRLSEARAVSDDWAKNHSPRSQPYLGYLQVLAAPVRFLWRCCCKLGHSTKNPIAWFLILVFLSIPILITSTIMALLKGLKWIRTGLTKAAKTRKDKTAQSDAISGEDVRCVSTSAFGPGTEMVERSRSPAELVKSSTHNPRMQTEKPIATSRMPGRSNEASPLRLTIDFWQEKLKRSPKSKSRVSPTLLENMLQQPNLFFELLSHLHGSDVRALSTVSRSVRTIITTHRSQRPHAVRRYICSRTQPHTPNETALPDPAHTSSPPSIAAPPASIAASSTTLSQTASDGTSIVDTLRRLFSFSGSDSFHLSHPCWSCGVIICPSCSKPKPNLRVSKTEIRLHSLQPVCSLCYFKALCGPYARRPQRRWPGSVTSQRRMNTRKVFKSLSAKCACTTKAPPRMEHALCEECHKLGEGAMWDRRMKRGAVATRDELPVNPIVDQVDSDSSDDEEEGTQAGEDVDIESIAASAVHNQTSSPQREDLDPGGHEKPVLATSIQHCYACHERLWILPSWLGLGKTRGLRWWRCRRCGLEARDVLMSLLREFT